MAIIRQENPEDYQAVYDLIKDAFEHAEHTDGDEQNLVSRLRKSKAFIPELSLVAEENGQIVGHIMFTKLKAGNIVQLALAPIAVSRNCQGRGIGAMLIGEGHRTAKRLGYEYSVLIGHPAYYLKFGYTDAAKFGLKAPFELPEGVFMAYNLQGKNTVLDAAIEYPKEFFEK